MNHVLHEVQNPDANMGSGNFNWGKGQTIIIVKYRHAAVICENTTEAIEVPFGLWTRMGRKHRVTWEFQIPHGNGQFWWTGVPIVKYRYFLW